MYNELHAKGLNIIGVSLDSDIEAWKKAIVKDKITWVQMSNLKGWEEPIARLFNVEQIPTTFVLDQTGKIVARDLTGKALKDKVKSLLGS